MITVIVPTMWKGKEINRMLPQLNDHPLVGEIILIDNDPSVRVQATCDLSKVVYYTTGQNIYPVPSWNYGWEHAKFDNLLIINDDVMFDAIIVDAMDSKISPNVGMITMHVDYCNSPLDDDTNLANVAKLEDVKFVDCNRLRHRAAVIIGIHKSVYEKIPEELLIHYNDYFLFKLCETRNKPNYSLTGAYAKTVMSTTVKHFKEIIKHEQRIYGGVFEKYGIKDKSC
jgi:hypothetical protein